MIVAILRLRDLLNDNYKYNKESQEYYGGAKIFPLEFANIDATTLVVKKNGVVWADTNYSYDADTGEVTVTGTLTSGDVLTFSYDCYERYSDGELRGYIRNALYYLAVEKYKVFTAKVDNVIFPTPTDAEYSLISIIASILMKGNIRQYRTPEFTIAFAENLSVEEKIKQTLRQFRKSYGYLSYIDMNGQSAESEGS